MYINCPLCLKYLLELSWEIRSDRLSRQCNTYMYILINRWIITTTTGSHCLKNRQMCSMLYHFTLHARDVHLQRVPRPQMLTNWDDASRTSEQSESRCLLNAWLAKWCQRLHAYVRAGGRHFEHMMWRTACLHHRANCQQPILSNIILRPFCSLAPTYLRYIDVGLLIVFVPFYSSVNCW